MKIGLPSWQGNGMIKSSITTVVMLILLTGSSAVAGNPYELSWSDRITIEKADGTLVDTPPLVRIDQVQLSRFAQMQTIQLHQSLTQQGYDGEETVHAFKVWQGGASQGEQLMLVTASQTGIDVVGPYPSEFEELAIEPATQTHGIIFNLIQSNNVTAKIEYFAGQLIQVN